MRLGVEQLADGIIVAFKEDAVRRDVHRRTALPYYASGTMALVTNKQPGVKEWTHVAIGASDERISHHTGLVATDGRDIFLTNDTSFVAP